MLDSLRQMREPCSGRLSLAQGAGGSEEGGQDLLVQPSAK